VSRTGQHRQAANLRSAQAKNLNYGFDFCPAFWDWIEEANRRQDVFSIEKVGDELLSGADELATWGVRSGKSQARPRGRATS